MPIASCRCRCIRAANTAAASTRRTIWRCISVRRSLPLLKRVVFTRSQIDLPKHERQRNVRDAFALDGDSTDRRIPAHRSWSCSSTMSSTTGATLEACARVLKAERRERSAGAYSSPSRDRTALITAADTASLSWWPSRRIQSVDRSGLAQVALAHAAEQRQVALELVARHLLARQRRVRRNVEQDRQRRLRQAPLDLGQPRGIDALRFAVGDARREIAIAHHHRARRRATTAICGRNSKRFAM